jgi:hypothetical protein
MLFHKNLCVYFNFEYLFFRCIEFRPVAYNLITNGAYITLKGPKELHLSQISLHVKKDENNGLFSVVLGEIPNQDFNVKEEFVAFLHKNNRVRELELNSDRLDDIRDFIHPADNTLHFYVGTIASQ